MQEITTREKLFALLGFFILLISLPLALLLVRQRVTYRGRAVGVAATPTNVKVTNIHSKGFTVSWITNVSTNGSILNASTEIQDVRGAADTYTTHYVDVLNLNPETNYYFKIKSGPNTYAYSSAAGWYVSTNSTAQGMTVKTAKQIGDENQLPSASNPYGAYSTEARAFDPCPDGTLNADGTPHMNAACFRPYPLWGEVKNPTGQPLAGAIVTAVIKEDALSPYKLSALTDNNGKWSLDLANQYVSNFTSYLAYNPSVDKINVWANIAGSEATTWGLNMVSVLSTDCPDQNTNCPMNDPSPVILVITPQVITTPSPTPGVTNPPNADGVIFSINKVQLQGRTNNAASFTVKFRQATSLNTSPVLATANVTSDSSGVVQNTTVASLTRGSYDIYLVPVESYLSAKLSNVNFSNGPVSFDFSNNSVLCNNGTKLCAGDIKGLASAYDDQIEIYDYQTTMGKFDKTRDSLTGVLKQADFNNSGTVDIYDYQFTIGNFNKKGADRP